MFDKLKTTKFNEEKLLMIGSGCIHYIWAQMKLPVCGRLLKMLHRPAKIEEQGKKVLPPFLSFPVHCAWWLTLCCFKIQGACYREPTVLVTLYEVKLRGALNTAACKPTGLRHRRRHRQCIGVQRAGDAGGGDAGGGYNRREELLRYCRNLRMSVADQPPPAPPPPPPDQCQTSPPRLHLPKVITSC